MWGVHIHHFQRQLQRKTQEKYVLALEAMKSKPVAVILYKYHNPESYDLRYVLIILLTTPFHYDHDIFLNCPLNLKSF